MQMECTPTPPHTPLLTYLDEPQWHCHVDVMEMGEVLLRHCSPCATHPPVPQL
jgi:hypothetical protein